MYDMSSGRLTQYSYKLLFADFAIAIRHIKNLQCKKAFFDEFHHRKAFYTPKSVHIRPF